MSDTSSKWEWPDLAAAAVLAAQSFLIIGGLGTGIVGWQGTRNPGQSVQTLLGSDLGILTSFWANAATAVFALAVVLGVRLLSDSSRRVAISIWAEVVLAVVMLGAVVQFVGQVLFDLGFPGSPPRTFWSHEIEAGGQLLATLVVGTVGLLIGGRLGQRGSGWWAGRTRVSDPGSTPPA